MIAWQLSTSILCIGMKALPGIREASVLSGALGGLPHHLPVQLLWDATVIQGGENGDGLLLARERVIL